MQEHLRQVACGCIGTGVIKSEPCGLLEAADELRPNSQGPTGERIRNLEEACEERERIEYKTRDYRCTPCYVAIHK